ncbi:hypothetical protein Tco_0525287 [Tanacetum coccineum]
MVFSIASHKEEGSSSTLTPPIPIFDLPKEIVETIEDLTFEKRAKLCYKMFLTILLKNHGLCIKGLRIHLDYPFLNVFHIHDLWWFPKEVLCFFYYLFKSFTIGITFNAEKLLSYVVKSWPGSFLPPKAVNDDGLVMYHAPYCFIHDWYKSKDHPDAYKWIKANGQWHYDNFDHCEVETSDDDDDDDARSL